MSSQPSYRIDPASLGTSSPSLPRRRSVVRARTSTENPTPDGEKSDASAPGRTFRVDRPDRLKLAGSGSAAPQPIDFEQSDANQEWLKLQATDLIDRLQAWAADLDAREAQLNVRASVQDHRERQFRMVQQDAVTELAEQKRSAERLRTELQSQARRMAFGE
ncbi:hypothetical protein [Rubripirellula reticaptiva]|uniref:Uncharacterized protein n=1 Tax=Rubripirellula reticaptiva TaxID=2528013 RepID=A0A5C6F6Y7_9BACT|nr:hypothetical protein [Rubripirellula reticaptiva]TWU56244.1 hypothetical protein Poly59_25480 [Rubripirellula reticaptiva]